ncbi:MAG: sugar phosphate isomerase/epimerase [Cyclobacteriaceae bacterium]|nr:sugar phosphate isomerase/epimerase [Cyclobacteriaceae bacterium]
MHHSRRDFLKRTAAGAVTGSVLGAMPLFQASCKSQTSVKGIIIGAHPWVYAKPLPNYDITPALEKIFSDMRYAGMAGVELMHDPLRSAETTGQIMALKDQYGLPVIGTSYGASMWNKEKHKEILNDAGMIITNLAKVGGKTIGVSVGNAGATKTEEQLDAQADLLKELMAICAANGVVLNLHNHTYEVENNMHDLRGTLKRIPDVKLGPDLNWLVRGGVDPVSFIREFGGQMVFCHLRDQGADGKWTEVLGEGVMDFKGIGEAFREVGFQGHAIIELAHEDGFVPTMEVKESLKQSREFVTKALRI